MNLDAFPNEMLSVEEENAIAISPKESDTRERLIMCSMREALLYSKKCSYGKLADGDLVSLCYLGLRDAAANFKPGIIRFFGYAKPYLRGRVCSEFRLTKVVKKSESIQHTPSDETDTPDTEYRTLEPEYENFNTEGVQLKEEWALLAPLVRDMVTDKERMILELRYISGMNFRQIGDLFAIPVSRSHIQHLHGTALAKIRAEMARRGLPLHYSK